MRATAARARRGEVGVDRVRVNECGAAPGEPCGQAMECVSTPTRHGRPPERSGVAGRGRLTRTRHAGTSERGKGATGADRAGREGRDGPSRRKECVERQGTGGKKVAEGG